MKIAIIGSGGVGGYFGARLAEAGNDLVFLARGAHAEAMRRNGLQLESIRGNVHIKEAQVVTDISAIPTPDLVIVAVKSWQVSELAPGIAGILGPDTLVLPLQNGVLSVEELAGILPADQVLSGLCRIFSEVKAPGIIEHLGVEPTIIFSERDDLQTERVRAVSRVFDRAGIRNIVPDDIEAERWKKFISICLSGLMAVTRTTYGEMRSIPEIRTLMFELMEEVWQVARAKGVKVEREYIGQAAEAFETYRFEATASLTRDVWAGRPSEIEYQNGTVIRVAARYGLDVPVNRFVYFSVLPGERRARKNQGTAAQKPTI